MNRQTWLSLQQRTELALSHLTSGLDWRSIARGTALEGTPFTHIYMGDHLLQMHGSPDLFECQGRYLTAISVCLDAAPTFSVDGKTAAEAAGFLADYMSRRVNAEGKAEVTDEELSLIDSPEYVYAKPVIPSNPSAAAKGWWNAARGVIYDGAISITLEGLVRWYLRTGDAKTKDTVSRMIRGKVSDPNGWGSIEGKGYILSGIMTPLAMYYEATGDESARRYLDEMADHFLSDRYPGMFPDGKHSHGDGVGHLHIRLNSIAGFARYAKLVGRSDYLEAAEELLAANLVYGTEFGFMPERHVFCCDEQSDSGGIYQPWAVGEGAINYSHFARPRMGWDTCEICVTADAVDTAIFLAKCGYEKYWDIAERMLNQVFEAQVRDDSFVVNRQPGTIKDTVVTKFDGVMDTLHGSFLSQTSPTWALPRKQYPKIRPDGREGVREGKYYSVGIACCHGWGARTLGLVWQNIVTEEGNRVDVNFPFDRETDKVKITSSLPFQGEVTVTALKPVELYVRIPDWVAHSMVEVSVNGKRRNSVEFKNQFSDYVKIGKVNPGEEVKVSYPLRREKKRYHIEYHPNLYEADWLGNYVMGMREIRVSEGQGTETFKGFGKLYPYL